MRRFLVSLSVLFVALFATLFAGEYAVRQVSNPYQIKNDQIIKLSDDVETLFLGSSHSYYGVRPEYIPHAFNLANSAQNLKYDCFMLERYGEMCPRLKTVVLSISYFTLFYAGFEGSENWRYAINYKIHMGCDYHSDFSKYNLELSHPSVFREKLRRLFFDIQTNSCDSLGWGMNYTLQSKSKTWETLDATAAVESHTANDWSCLETNRFYLEQIVSYCRSHSVELILITTPTWHAYYERLDEKQLSQMYSVIREMQQKYRLRYFDYLKDRRFESDDFYDSDHLSEMGARKFSLLLKEEVLKGVESKGCF